MIWLSLLIGCLLVCFCVAEMSGAVITTTAVTYYFTNSLSLSTLESLLERALVYVIASAGIIFALDKNKRIATLGYFQKLQSEQINMNHRLCPEANSNSKPDFGSVSFTCLRVRQFIGDMELLMYQQQQRVAELEDKHKQCKCEHDTQATSHLVQKVAYLEEQLKSKDKQLRMSEQLQQADVLDKTKPKGAAKRKKVGNGWILFMKQRSLEKDLGEKFETLEAFLKYYAKDNRPEVKKHKHKNATKFPSPKKERVLDSKSS